MTERSGNPKQTPPTSSEPRFSADRLDAAVASVCVFSYLAEELRSGDLSIVGSGEFADYREQLLSWEEGQELLPAYCDKIGLPQDAATFAAGLRDWLADTAQHLDDKFPECRGDVALTATGEPVLRKPIAREIPPSAMSLQNALTQRMPARHILDVLANIEHWMGFTRHFGPLSGNMAKLKQPAERYLLTIFAMGCNLGPTQAARHLGNSGVTPHMLSFVNRRHLSLLAFAFHIALTERYASRFPPFALDAAQLVVPAGVFAVIAPVGPLRVAWTPGLVFAIGLTGILATTVGIGLQTWAQARTSAVRAALIYALEPVFAVGYSTLITNERIGATELVGGGLIVAGVVVGEVGAARLRVAQ